MGRMVHGTGRLVILCLLMCAGCSDGPRAPVLGSGPIFQNTQEGIRFQAPEGWAQTARAEVPPGKLQKERLLVSYRANERAAEFEVSAADLPAATDLGSYLAERSYGARNWKQASPPAKLDIGGSSGDRYVLTGRIEKDPMTLEVVAVRKGERVYFFKGLFPTTDVKVSRQIRACVNSVILR